MAQRGIESVESVEYGPEDLPRSPSKTEFEKREARLRTELLELQRAIEAHPQAGQSGNRDLAVVVVIAGVEGAGKGAVVHRLTEWLDTRGVETHAFWRTSDDERERPWFWRFWRRLPARGRIGILFGSWYTEPIIGRVYRKLTRKAFDEKIERIREFERLITSDRTVLLKLWFDISEKEQEKRFGSDVIEGVHTAPEVRRFAKHYGRFTQVSEQARSLTDTGYAPWYVLDSKRPRYRDLMAGYLLRDVVRARLSELDIGLSNTAALAKPAQPAKHNVLDGVALDRRFSREKYARSLRKLQRRLGKLAWAAREAQVNTVIVFEGWDAAGKGGAIRRLTQAMDPRLYQVIPIAAPNEEERAYHYLWRFWRHVPRDGQFTIYDRSWYGRVLVERIEGFASAREWQRAYREINEFEVELADHGAVVEKFWLHISAEEQLSRFREREQIPWKQHKLTEEDWRNREKWPDYAAAVHDMVERTSTDHAPWHLIAAEDKKVARIQVLEAVCDALERRLER